MSEKTVIEDLRRRMAAAGPGTSKDVRTVIMDMASLFVTLIIYLTASVLIGLVVYKIIVVGGIEAVLAQLMANTCATNPAVPCDFTTLLAGTGLSLVILTGLAISIFRQTIKMEDVPFYDIEPSNGASRNYNEDMVKVLRYIQALGGVDDIKNLRGLGDWIGVPYTSMRRYVSRYQADGYIVIQNNGQGAPMEIRLK